MEKRGILTRSGRGLIPLNITWGFLSVLFFTFIPLQVYNLYGFVASSLCTTLAAISSILLSWVWGWISDVFISKKKLLSLAMIGQSAFTMLFAISSRVKGELFQLLFLLFLYSVASLFSSLFMTVRNAVITLMTERNKRGANLGVFFLLSSLGWALGGYLIGFWLTVWTFSQTLLLISLLHICSLIVFLWLFQAPEPQIDRPKKRGLFESLRAMDPVLFQVMLSILIVSVGRGMFYSVFRIKTWIVIGRASMWMGIITSLAGMAGAVGSLLYGTLSDRIGHETALLLAIGANIPMFLLSILNYPITLALVWIFPVAPFLLISSVAFAADYSKKTRRGEAQGIINSAISFSDLFSVIGGIIAVFLGASQDLNKLMPFFLSLCAFPCLSVIPLWKARNKARYNSIKNAPRKVKGNQVEGHTHYDRNKIQLVRNEALKFFIGAPPSHDWSHVERVVELCLKIGKKEDADLEILHLAALLHDVARKKEDEHRGNIDHALEGTKIAQQLLKKYNYPDDMIQKVLHCIECHRFRKDRTPTSKEAKILFDADKIDAIGAIGVARLFAFTGEIKTKFYDTGNLHKEEMEEVKSYSRSDTAYREFLVKLSRIKDKLFTRTGKDIAGERDTFTRNFFKRLKLEVRAVK